jgi:lipopolysaccharide heptosyltransferase II
LPADARERWGSAREILCVRLDSMGDVLMTVPAMRAVRNAVPGRRLTLLTSPAGAAAAALVPEVDEVIVYEAPWMKATGPRRDPSPDHLAVKELVARGFDAAIVFTVYSQSALPAALMCHLAEIPLRLAHSRENPYALLTDWIREREPHDVVRHEVQRQLDLVASIGSIASDPSMSLAVPAQARASVNALLAEEQVDVDGPWAVVHPGATAPSRRYPPEGFAAAARRLTELGWSVVFTGDVDEIEVVERARAGVPSASLAGRLDLDELAALLERAPLLIANNSGPVHVACAVGTPVIDLYALTNPQHMPWGVPHRVLFHDVPCRWCYSSICREGHHDCLRRVTPDDIVDAAVSVMEEAAARSPLDPSARSPLDPSARLPGGSLTSPERANVPRR